MGHVYCRRRPRRRFAQLRERGHLRRTLPTPLSSPRGGFARRRTTGFGKCGFYIGRGRSPPSRLILVCLLLFLLLLMLSGSSVFPALPRPGLPRPRAHPALHHHLRQLVPLFFCVLFLLLLLLCQRAISARLTANVRQAQSSRAACSSSALSRPCSATWLEPARSPGDWLRGSANRKLVLVRRASRLLR